MNTNLTDLTDFDSFGVLPLRDQMKISVACTEENRKRLRVYTIVDFSFIRTFAPSF